MRARNEIAAPAIEWTWIEWVAVVMAVALIVGVM
jgi:hypothetical protein